MPNTKPNTKLATKITKLLNTLLTLDPTATRNLVEQRIPCNDALANHPTVQVMVEDGKTSVGLLGVLNGLCGSDAIGGIIVAKFKDPECQHLMEFYVREQIVFTDD
ncbi:MAG: hypothetical protein WDA42_04170 [Candidatus Bathyarchaeia archaeon]|jgi:hypothetical protein